MKFRIIIIAVLALLILTGLAFFIFKSDLKKGYNARLDGKLFQVMTQVPGQIKTAAVQADMFVSRDFPMFELTNPDVVREYEEADASLLSIEQGIVSPQSSLSVNIEHFEQRVNNTVKAEAEAKKLKEELSLRLAEAALARRKAEANPKAYSREYLAQTRAAEEELQKKMDEIAGRLEQAVQARARAEQELTAIREQFRLFSTPQGMDALRRYELEASKERLQAATEKLNSLSILSPVDGYVLEVFAVAGAEVAKGALLATIVPLDAEFLWLNTYFDETTASALRIGQLCDIEFTALDGLSLSGRIRSIRPATLTVPISRDDFPAEFSDIENPVPVIVSLEDYDPAEMPPLRFGMTAKVSPR